MNETSQTLDHCCGSHMEAEREPVETGSPATSVETVLRVKGMRCGACAGRVREALLKIEGVLGAQVSLEEATARVIYDPRHARPDDLVGALRAAGYAGEPSEEEIPPSDIAALGSRPVRRWIWGAAAALAVVGFYLGLITLTSSWSNARYQFGEYGGWVIALALGLGVQVGLFVHMRAALAGARLKGAASGMAASGGMSGVAMALCCSHYLAAVLPAIGLPFFSGAIAGLVEYQTAFFAVGVVSNLLGIAYMLRLQVKSGVLTLRLPVLSGTSL